MEREIDFRITNSRDLVGDILFALVSANGQEHRLVAYFLELALAEARRARGEHPALWYQTP